MAGSVSAIPGDSERGRLRASHADRDGVINTLKSAYVLGFVTKEEFDARVSETLAARTYAELTAVTTDLPAVLNLAAPPSPRAPARATLRPVDRAIVGLALLAAIAFATAIVSRDGWVALGAVGSALASLSFVAAQLTMTRHPRQPGGQLPGGALPGRIAASPGTAAAGSAPKPPSALERGRRPGDARPLGRRRPLLSC